MAQREDLYLGPDGKSKVAANETAITELVKEHLDTGVDINKVMKDMKIMNLDPRLQTSTDVAKKKAAKRKSCKRLNSRQKRELGIYNIAKEAHKYELFVPLHQLWEGYMKDLFGQGQNLQQFAQKLLKADYHGAILTVIQCTNPVNVGITGIVVQETLHLFRIITKEDKLKHIPKANTVFRLQVNACQASFTLYGHQLIARAADRAAKKFKPKPSIEM